MLPARPFAGRPDLVGEPPRRHPDPAGGGRRSAEIPGVRPPRRSGQRHSGCERVGDLLLHVPFRYERYGDGDAGRPGGDRPGGHGAGRAAFDPPGADPPARAGDRAGAGRRRDGPAGGGVVQPAPSAARPGAGRPADDPRHDRDRAHRDRSPCAPTRCWVPAARRGCTRRGWCPSTRRPRRCPSARIRELVDLARGFAVDRARAAARLDPRCGSG